MTPGTECSQLIVGKIAGPYGVRGWLHVYSYTDPRSNILNYQPWYIGNESQWRPYEVFAGREHGKGIVVKLASLNTREDATEIRGALIAVDRAALPPLKDGDYYWHELVGMRVVTLSNADLGRIDHILATGANDVLVVVSDEKERLIPYVKGEYIKEVNKDKGLVVVDWEPDF